MPITLGELAKDPSLIEKLRIPPDLKRHDDEDVLIEALSIEIEQHPIHSPGLRRG